MTAEDIDRDIDIDALLRGTSSRRRWLIPLAVFAALVAAATIYLLLRGGESDIVIEPQPAQATLGQLTTTLSISGTAAAGRSANLSFGVGGEVVTVEVEAGDEVSAGDALARLDPTQLELALAQAQLDLVQSQERLADALAGPDAVALTAAKLAVTEAESDLIEAETGVVDTLASEPSDAAVSAAEQAVTRAESDLVAANNDPVLVASRAGLELTLATEALEAVQADPGASAVDLAVAENRQLAAFAVLKQASDALVALRANLSSPELDLARASVDAAETALAGAEATLAQLESDPDATDDELAAAAEAVAVVQEVLNATAFELAIAQLEATSTAAAEAAVTDAEAALASAEADLDALFDGPSEESTIAAEARVPRAELALLRADTDLSALLAGSSASDIASFRLTVSQRENALDQAGLNLESATLLAPFDGVVEVVGVEAGDLVNANALAFQLVDVDEIVLDLTVTESDVLSLVPGLTGLATFDAIDGQQYPLRIMTVSRLPTISQGVVTYPVQAVLLQGTDAADAAQALSALDGDGAAFGGGGFGGGGFGGGGFGGAGGRGALGQLFGDIELPEGVTIADVLSSVINDEPLPEGVTLPEDFELPEQFRQGAALAAAGDADGGGLGGGPGDGRLGGGQTPGTAAQARPMPAPGMSASVTLLIDVRAEAVLVPVAAVRQLDDAFFVVLPADEDAYERLDVTVGSSDGISVEILEGLEPGTTVLIGADNSGVPFSATQLQLPDQQFPGFGGGGFGGGGGGFGGGGGGFGGGGGGGGFGGGGQ